MNVQPIPRWSNGKWRRKIVSAADTYTNAGTSGDPIVLAEPAATAADADAKIYPFKVMTGRQPADTVNKRLIVPHLFGSAAGPNAYWDSFDWTTALQEGRGLQRGLIQRHLRFRGDRDLSAGEPRNRPERAGPVLRPLPRPDVVLEPVGHCRSAAAVDAGLAAPGLAFDQACAPRFKANPLPVPHSHVIGERVRVVRRAQWVGPGMVPTTGVVATRSRRQ